MTKFDLLPTEQLEAAEFQRDFITCEDELPTAVIVTAGGIFERGKLATDVKYETTDDK